MAIAVIYMCVISTSDIFSVLHTRCDAMNFSVSVIEEFGGYEKVVEKLKNPLFCFLHNVAALENHLIEYRKEKKIFISGDKVVLDNDDRKIYEIDFKDERHCAFFMKCGKAFSYSLVLRHAHKIEENIRICI